MIKNDRRIVPARAKNETGVINNGRRVEIENTIIEPTKYDRKSTNNSSVESIPAVFKANRGNRKTTVKTIFRIYPTTNAMAVRVRKFNMDMLEIILIFIPRSSCNLQM